MAPRRPRTSVTTPLAAVLAALVTSALVATALLWAPLEATASAPARTTTGLVGASFLPTSLRPVCPSRVSRPFRPTVINATGARRTVVAPGRVNGGPGTPPISTTGKNQWAWDRWFVWPGARRGNVLLNAHTWPDGTALGNRLLARLYPGARIVVRGSRGQTLCYRVTRRFEVPAGLKVPSFYSGTGPPQLAIAVCSGVRLGPGHWSRRTIWYAVPSS